MPRVYKRRQLGENVCHYEECPELITHRYYRFCGQHIEEDELDKENRINVRARLYEDGFLQHA